MSTLMSFRLPDELAGRLRSYSDESGVSQTRLVVDALRAALDGDGVRAPRPSPPKSVSGPGAGTEGVYVSPGRRRALG